MFQRQKKNQQPAAGTQPAAERAEKSRTDDTLHGWSPPSQTTPRKTTRPTRQDPDRDRNAGRHSGTNGERTTSYPQGQQGAPNPKGAPRTTSYPSPLMAGRRGYKSIN